MPDDPGTSSVATPSSHSATIHLYKAPITEVALATLKFFSPESSAKFEETIGHLIVAFAKSQTLVEPREESSSGQSDRLGEPQMKGLLAAAWGRVQEREDQYVFAFGWESLQVRSLPIPSPPSIKSTIPGTHISSPVCIREFDDHATATIG